MLFDTVVMVDWSAANQPRQGRDSIWAYRHGAGGETLVNPATRHQVKALLAEWLADAVGRCERVLVGFDFPFGYSAGFAARLGLGGPPWRAAWDEIARLIEDDADNRNNRFRVAAALNRRISNGMFPFWGCPAAEIGPYLGHKHHRGHEAGGLSERRLIDQYMRGAQPCWKLLGAGSVGGQALTGIPVVRALRDDPRWREQARVWPFETGLGAPDGTRVVFAEVYPSLWAVAPQTDEPKDAAQVRDVARFFAARDRAGELGGYFVGDAGLDADQRQQVESEEAWTLGVTARGQARLSVPSATLTHQPCGLVPPLPHAGEGASPGLGPEEVGQGTRRYAYLRDPTEISRRSFALVRQEADLRRFPASLRSLALRLAHAAGDTSILGELAWSRGAVAAGRAALAAGAPILVDSRMVAAGIRQIGNPVLCTLDDPEVPGLATRLKTTRSAAAVELWRPHLAGAVVAIGNAPTALFHLLEMLMARAAPPAVILGFPVGFVGASEAKVTLAGFGHGLAYITVHGRRGGSALAAAAVNALARR
jgi:precorrin-8X/cobalt-precorrin-8 methylmutase